MLYFAYGMNTDPDGMAQRCPGSVSLGAACLLDHKFRFAFHADVVPSPGSSVNGVLWMIDQHNLNSLDTIEGYPSYYDRVKLAVQHRDRVVQAWCYRMQPGNPDALPGQSYLDCLLYGYQYHAVPAEQIHSFLTELGQPQRSAVVA